MKITTNTIMEQYEDGKAHTEIAQYIVDCGELDDMTEALKVVEDVILQCKRRKNNATT